MKSVTQLLANLDAWLDTMRTPTGYGGPVVHWWQHCLSYTGSGLDWRYEGIIAGYLELWHRTGHSHWLVKACRAGDDLVEGQLPDCCYRNSSFEQNPYSHGTPHEAAADLALLRLASDLRDVDLVAAERYAHAGESNLRYYHLGMLWDYANGFLRNARGSDSFVANKACTFVEVLFAMAEFRGDYQLVDEYGIPTLELVLTLQIHRYGKLTGAISQDRVNRKQSPLYFPYYVSRCIPALLLGYNYTAEARWLEAAIAAARFVEAQMSGDGLPQVLYEKGLNRYPQWISPLGDVLRILKMLAPFGANFDLHELECILMSGVLPSGGIMTAKGFGSQTSQRLLKGGRCDFRDLLPVVGWCDKAFHYFSTLLPVGDILPSSQTESYELPCEVAGMSGIFRETPNEFSLFHDKSLLYHWQKGQDWADVVSPQVIWK